MVEGGWRGLFDLFASIPKDGGKSGDGVRRHEGTRVHVCKSDV